MHHLWYCVPKRFPTLILQQFKSCFPLLHAPSVLITLPWMYMRTHECTHSHRYRVNNPNSFRLSVLSGSSRTPRSSWGWWDSRFSRNHVDATSKSFFPGCSTGLTTGGRCIIPFFYSFQFHFAGNSQKGPLASPQEAQARAILQQTQVHRSFRSLSSIICQHLGHFMLSYASFCV